MSAMPALLRHPIRTASAAALILTLAGCGGGGDGGSDAPAGGGPAVPVTAVPLGSRSLPDCDIAVERVTASAPGTWTFRVRLTPTSGAVASVAVRLGETYSASGYAAATQVVGQANVYEITRSRPDTPPPQIRAWVRITMANGNVLESGVDDFGIGPG